MRAAHLLLLGLGTWMTGCNPEAGIDVSDAQPSDAGPTADAGPVEAGPTCEEWVAQRGPCAELPTGDWIAEGGCELPSDDVPRATASVCAEATLAPFIVTATGSIELGEATVHGSWTWRDHTALQLPPSCLPRYGGTCARVDQLWRQAGGAYCEMPELPCVCYGDGPSNTKTMEGTLAIEDDTLFSASPTGVRVRATFCRSGDRLFIRDSRTASIAVQFRLR